MPKARKTRADFRNLCDATRASRKVFEVYRRVRKRTIDRYAGDNWTTSGEGKSRPVNFLSLYLSIVPKRLISHDPRFSLKTFDKSYKATLLTEEKWGNREVVRMNLAETLHRVILDALIGPMGITKVALATPGEAEKYGWGLEFGQPFCEVIDLDDFAMDPHARTPDQAAWFAHRCRYPLEALQNSKLYPAAKRKKLRPSRDRKYNQSGDERVSMLQRQYVSNEEIEVYDSVDIWEYYFPRERMCAWMLSDDGGEPDADDFGKGEDEAFDEKEWVGPDDGPLDFWRYLIVPGQAIGKGPVQDIVNLDEHLNGLTQKLIEQASRQKEVFAVHGSADGDVQRYRDARDGEAIRLDNPDKIKPLVGSGANPNNQAFAMQIWDLLNKLSGNLELMGGLSPQSKTLGQDKMLQSNSSGNIADMQQVTVTMTAKIITKLCWFWHHHPAKEMQAFHEIPGASKPIVTTARPGDRRRVNYDDVEIQVHPYSFNYQSPQETMAFLDQTMTQIVMPMMPLLQQQGIFVDISKYLEIRAKNGNVPELTDIIRVGPPVEPQGDGRNDQPGMPQQTERTYNRVNSSEATQQGQSKAMQQALLGQNPGGSQ